MMGPVIMYLTVPPHGGIVELGAGG